MGQDIPGITSSIFCLLFPTKKKLGRAKGGMAESLSGSATVTTLLSGELSRAGVNIPRARFLHGGCPWKMAAFRSSNSMQTHRVIPFAYGKEVGQLLDKEAGND